ncbi:MAG: hypothetical protein NTX97_05740 [Bacteroidetes bacterium]|nr:hypothetical protein [Bacteroidota bacterium]
MEIDKKVLAQATACIKSISCLNKSSSSLCEVVECLNNTIYFLNCAATNTCNYKVSFGISNTCTCPVRKEIFDKYNV